MLYYAYDFSMSADVQDLFIGLLVQHEIDFTGVEQSDEALSVSIQIESESKAIKVGKALEVLAARPDIQAQLHNTRCIASRNWNEEWEKGLKSVDVPPFFIKPDVWQGEVPEGRIVLRINPKMAFGTGYHETTRLVLSLLQQYVKAGDSLIDAGTGTGILAIGAAKLGAKKVFGFDIDPWSKENASENVALNSVSSVVDIALGGIETLEGQQSVDGVLANINRNALIELLPKLCDYVNNEGYLILSGLLEADQSIILAQKSLATEFSFEKVHKEGEWIALAFKKHASNPD